MEEDICFIKAVHSRPLLWDSRLEEYKNVEFKNAAWLEIAGDISKTGRLKKEV